jgi:hypothetical protein
MNLDQLALIIEVILDSGVLVPGIAMSLGLYVVYILLSAKNVVPLTTGEAETLWKSHRQIACCKAESWQEIIKRKKIIGYECECGHKHIQKKPLVNVR